MNEWRQKSKPPNSPDQNLTALYRTTHHQDYSVKIKPTKKYLPNFSYPIRIQELNILNPKILRSSLSIEVRSTFTGVSFHPKFLNQKFAYGVLHNRKTDCRIRSWIGETYKSKGKNHKWKKKKKTSILFVDISLRCYGVRYTPSRSLILYFAHAYTSATIPALIVWYRSQLRF